MPWGIRQQDGGVEPVQKPEPLDVSKSAVKNHPELRNLQAAVDTARAAQLPGKPDQMVPTLSVADHEPSQSLIDGALGS
jgi:hypothetical protein